MSQRNFEKKIIVFLLTKCNNSKISLFQVHFHWQNRFFVLILRTFWHWLLSSLLFYPISQKIGSGGSIFIFRLTLTNLLHLKRLHAQKRHFYVFQYWGKLWGKNVFTNFENNISFISHNFWSISATKTFLAWPMLAWQEHMKLTTWFCWLLQPSLGEFYSPFGGLQTKIWGLYSILQPENSIEGCKMIKWNSVRFALLSIWLESI